MLPLGRLEPEIGRATVIDFEPWCTHVHPRLNTNNIRFEYPTKQRFNGPCPGYSGLPILSVDTPERLHVNQRTTSGTEIA
jgi:hypothetical protein